MSQADLYYKEIIENVVKHGYFNEYENVRAKWKDGSPAYTKSSIGYSLRFDNSEVPILTTKKVAWVTAIKELLWIWKMQSNKVKDLRNMGVKIWNEWELPDGTIGKAYGYQLGKRNRKVKIDNTLKQMIKNGQLSIKKLTLLNKIFGYVKLNQVDYLLYQLKTNPSSRRHITMLWNPDDLDDMSLTPCVYETQWHVKDYKLHLEVRCRSNDLGLGHPFNVFQYNVLQRMIAQVLGYEVGEYIYHIGDAHIYSRHYKPLLEQIDRETYDAPILWINPEIKSFYDFTIDDFKLIDYKHGEKVDLEVAI